MRVLQVDKFLRRFGGAAGYMLDLAEGQASRGYDVEFFSMQHPENLPSRFSEHFPPLVRFDDNVEGLREQFTAAHTMIYNHRAATGFTRVLDAFKPDIVHVHNIYHQLSPSILRAARKKSVPVVMTVHDYKLVCPTYHMIRDGEVCDACVTGGIRQVVTTRCSRGSLAASALLGFEAAFQRTTRAYEPVDRYIVPSEFLAEQMRRASVFPDRITVVPHGMALPARDAGATSTRDGSVVFAGRLASIKGVDTFIQAVGLLGGVQAHVLGTGPEEAALRKLADEIAPGLVTFHGQLGKDAVSRFFRTSSVGVLAARSFENQPMSLLEGMAEGLPFVATDLGGIPELVRPGHTGELVPPNDPKALSVAIGELLADHQRQRTYGANAQAFVHERHDLSHHLDTIEGIYSEVISK